MNQTDFEKERNKIINKAKSNGPKENIILKLIKRHKWSKKHKIYQTEI